MVGAKSCKLLREAVQCAAVIGVLPAAVCGVCRVRSAGFGQEEVCLGRNGSWGEWWRSAEGCPVSVGLGDNTAGVESTVVHVK